MANLNTILARPAETPIGWILDFEIQPVKLSADELRESAYANRPIILVPTKMGAHIPLSLVTKLKVSTGAPEIASEGGLLRSIVFLNVRGRDMGGFVHDAKKMLDHRLKLPAGYYVGWSGQWENQVKMQQRMKILIPMGLLIIFILLYFTFHSALEASMVMLSVPFALVGGVFMVYALHYNLSTAVWVGFIALYGVAVALMGLVPIMWSTGAGADVMKPIAAPMIGGMISSAIHVLIMTPVIFVLMKVRDLRKGMLKYSGMKH